MKTRLEEQDIAEVFTDQAETLGFDTPPISAIVGRGQARRRRRIMVRGAAVLVALVSVTYGSIRLLTPTPDRLAVTASATTAAATAPSDPATTPTTTIAPQSTLANAATSGPTDFAAAPIGPPASELVANPRLGRGVPVAYRDGFLLSFAEASDGDSSTEPSRLTFVFTADGQTLQTVGELEVEGGWSRPAVDGNTVALAAVTGADHTELHLYRSNDLTTWREDVIDLAAVGPLADLTPAMRELLDVDVSLRSEFGEGGVLVMDDEDWVLSVGVRLFLAGDPWQDFNLDRDAGISLSRSGLTVDSGDTVSIIPPAELGVTEADLASYERASANGENVALAGRWGQSAAAVADVEAGTEVLRFGDGFAALGEDGRILVSDNGREWAPLATDLPDQKPIAALTGLDGDLLALTRDGGRTDVYRIVSGQAPDYLGEVPVPAGFSIGGWLNWSEGPGVITASRDEQTPVDDVILQTTNYEITLVIDEGVDPDDSPVHYVVRSNASGEVIAENIRDFGDWRQGVPIDGVMTVIFTDAEGRPDVHIPLSEWEDAIDRSYQAVAADPTVALDDSTGSSRGYVELATADGVHWYQNPDPAESVVAAVNGSRVLLTRQGDDPDWFEVIEIGGTPPQS